MFNKKEEKYTMEEFKEMFKEANHKTMEKLMGDYKTAGAQNNKEIDPMAEFAFSLQNSLVISVLEHYLFNEEEGEE